jgi:hypothetical protein
VTTLSTLGEEQVWIPIILGLETHRLCFRSSHTGRPLTKVTNQDVTRLPNCDEHVVLESRLEGGVLILRIISTAAYPPLNVH